MTCAGVRVLEKLMTNHTMTVYNDVCRGEGAGEADDEPHDDGVQ